MERRLLSCLLLSGLLIVTACASHLYTVKLKDGQEVVAVGKPDFQEDAGAYVFRDLDGKRVILNREEVGLIHEGVPQPLLPPKSKKSD
jgi:hypothetical protein